MLNQMSLPTFYLTPLQILKIQPHMSTKTNWPKSRVQLVPAHSISRYQNLQTSETCISKTSALNAIKFGNVVNNAIVYNISNVWTCGS